MSAVNSSEIKWLVNKPVTVATKIVYEHYLKIATLKSVKEGALLGCYLVSVLNEVYEIIDVIDCGNHSRNVLYNIINPMRNIELDVRLLEELELKQRVLTFVSLQSE